MYRSLIVLSLSLTLTGCVGTFATQRETDTSAPYPSLHSVPDRPPKIDFKRTDAAFEDFEEDYEKKIELNESIRKSTPRVTRPEE